MNSTFQQSSTIIHPKISKSQILEAFQKSRPALPNLQPLLDMMSGIFTKETQIPENYNPIKPIDPKEAILESASTPKPMRQVIKKIVTIPKSPFNSSGYIEDPTLRVWYYIDENNQVQGPFTSLEMDNWFDNGYLFNELLIRLREKNDFVTLIQLFGKAEMVQTYVPALGFSDSVYEGVKSDGLKREGQSSSSSKQQTSVFNFGYDNSKTISSPNKIKKTGFFTEPERGFEENKDNLQSHFDTSLSLTPNKKSPPRGSQRNMSGTPSHMIINNSKELYKEANNSLNNSSFLPHNTQK